MFTDDSAWGIIVACFGGCLLLETRLETEEPNAATIRIRIITVIAVLLLSCLGGVECRSKRLFNL